jgi:hypothetical protein
VIQPTRTIIHNPNGTTTVIVQRRSYLDPGTEVPVGYGSHFDYAFPPSITGATANLASGLVQGNLAILPEKLAAAFHRFCQLNPKPCPIIPSSRGTEYGCLRGHGGGSFINGSSPSVLNRQPQRARQRGTLRDGLPMKAGEPFIPRIGARRRYSTIGSRSEYRLPSKEKAS